MPRIICRNPAKAPAATIRCLAALAAAAAVLSLPSAGWAAVRLPGDITVNKVDFERHVVGLFGRMGCNSGSCHGSFQGKNGFRLSLFGYDPARDYFALTRDLLGRRIDPVDPEHSLLLLKPTGAVPHGGGTRFGKDSWQYQILREWLVAGARWEKGTGEVSSITVAPAECVFHRAGETARLRVRARFADESEEDITPFCDFRINDDAVAEAGRLGEVKALRPGDTALVISYRGHIVPVRVMVPATLPPGVQYPRVAENNYIDREVFAKLRRLNLIPSGTAGDAEFLRRVTIDTIGTLPSPEEVRAFLADADPDKRAKKIDELLAHPLHAALWATKFSDITGNNTDALEQPREKHSKMWHDWFRKRLAENMPYDEIVRGVLCATSRDGRTPEDWLQEFKTIEQAAEKGFDTGYAGRPSLDLFWRRQQAVTTEQWGEKTAAAFMGVRLECAQCHKHPFDRWTQADYRSYANVFSQVAFGVAPESRKVVDAEVAERKKKGTVKGKQAQTAIREIYVGGKGRTLPDPDTNRPLPARALGGPVIAIEKGQDARAALFTYLRSPDNPYFARSFVNRVWGHYFGVGLVDPVDDFSLANPPSNPKLLDALARDFVEHRYDIRELERTILNSRVYQLSSLPNATNQLDRNNFSHSFVRRLMAEAVVDVLDAALGVKEDFGPRGKVGPDAPPGSHAIEVAPSRVQNGNLAYAFRIFGRPPRTSACDCERAMEPALPQTLFLMTDQALLAKLQSPQGRLQQLLKSGKSDEQVLEELVLATLSRFPTAEEKKLFTDYMAAHVAREKTLAPAGRPEKAEPSSAARAESAAREKPAKKGKPTPPGKGKTDVVAKPKPQPAQMPAAVVPPRGAVRQKVFTDTLWALINTREFILNH